MSELRRPVYFGAALFGLAMFAAGPALAGGGSGFQLPDLVPGTEPVQSSGASGALGTGFGTTYSWAAETVDVHSSSYSFYGTVEANGAASNTPAGVGSAVAAGGYGVAAENGNTPISVTSTNFSETFAKGAFSISLGEASLYATVTVNGRQYLVAKELAVALSRGTPSGTSASTYVSATSPDGGSYSTTQVIVTKSGSH